MNDTFLNSANAPYVAELYFKFSQDPNSVDKNWGEFFNTLDDDHLSVIKDFGGPEWKKRPSSIIDTIMPSETVSDANGLLRILVIIFVFGYFPCIEMN